MKKIFVLCFLFIGFILSAQQQWEKHTTIADSLDLKLQFEESLPYRKNAIKAAVNQPDSIQKLLLGLQMFTQAEYDFEQTKKPNSEAYALMQNAVGVLEKANAKPERISKAYWDLNLASFNYMRNQQDTEKFLNKSIEYHLKSSEIDTLFLLNTIHGSSYMSMLSGNYEKSIETSEKGIALFDQYRVKEDKENNLKGYLYSNLALVYHLNGLNIPQKSLLYLNESEKVFSSMNEPDLEYFIGIYINLASAESRGRNHKNAEGYLNKALNLYESNKEKFHSSAMHYVGFKKEFEIYAGLIILYRDSGNKDKMLKIFAKVKNIVQNNELDQTEKNQYAGMLRSVGRYYLGQEYDFDKAVMFINKALKLNTERTVIHSGGINTSLHLDLAKAYLLKKDYPQALKIIERTEETHALEPYQIELKAKCLLGLNRPDEAVDAVNEVLIAISEDNRNFQFPKSTVKDFTSGYTITNAGGLVGLAEAFRDYYGKYSIEEEKLYWIALTQMENNIGNAPLNKDLKNTFDKITSGLIDAALVRDFSTEESNRLLTFIETIKSQHLTDNFLMKREIAGNTQLYNLVEKEQYIRSYIALLKKEYQKNKDEETKQQLFEKELELKKVNEQIVSQYRNSSQFIKPAIDISEISSKNVIKFEVSNGELYKLRLYNGQLSYKKIVDYPALKKEIEAFLTNINNLEISVSTLKKQGESLYNKLFTDDFNTKAPTAIIPDDILYYLPFEVLVHNNKYLIENHTISYASNFYFLNAKNLTKNNSNSKKAVFFAPKYSGVIQESQLAVRGEAYSLAGAAEEVNQISKFIPGKVYLGDLASKTNFKTLESDISILHLAMHSILNDEDPELSNLMFSNSEEDYEMYISELYGLNFNAELAVLSACNTGIGGFKDGGNLISMHHAFTTAGIPATVSSLWNAPDQSTKEIMIAFYKNLQQGQDKATALRQAKLSYLKNTQDENLQHPFYWAGFVLSGDDSPILLPEVPFWKKPVTFFGILALLGLGITVFFLRKQRNS